MVTTLISVQPIEHKIFIIRGLKVMIDRDLAELYEISTKVLNQSVKRNLERFPSSFMFKLTKDELNELVTNCDRFKNLKHSSSTPYVFTEYGIAMLSSVLRNKKAIAINIEIIETFIRLKKYTIEHNDLLERINELENYLFQYAKDNNQEVDKINQAINLLLEKTRPTQIGFITDKEQK